ncbi:MAG: ImmA/IrrE family metallo-endopeptidase [Polyangiaceae bacterium]
MTRVDVSAKLLEWACERSGLELELLTDKFAKLPEWIEGESSPTLKQLERFAKATRTPLGYLFLPEPPAEQIPLPDLRTVRRKPPRPSPELLDTVYAMQHRQSWLREMLLEDGAEPLSFVGSATLSDDPQAIGTEMRRLLGLDDGWADAATSWQQAVSELRRQIEGLGIMAVINGVVGNNTHRSLSVDEFRGFAISDPVAPLVFVNGADAKSAQMFTLAHEVAHIWLGAAALSGFESIFPGGSDVETWCDKAAAEFLVPARTLKQRWPDARRADSPFEALARQFKVSPIVAARRALDLRLVDRTAFFTFYNAYMVREASGRPRSGGGDFYNNQNTRVGQYFAGYVIRAAMEGRIGFKEAYDLTGLRGGAFQEYAHRLGVDI